MHVTTTNNSDTNVTLSITATEAELNAAKKRILETAAKTVKAPGFRAGKAPLAVVEKQLDDNQVQGDTLQEVVNVLYSEAVDSKKLRVLASPQVEIKKFTPYTALEFTAAVDVMPKVALGDYKKIKKTKPKIAVSDKDVAEVLDNLRGRSATKKPVDRAAKNGDEVVLDFDGEDAEGKAVAGASGKDYPLELGSNSFIPGFEEGLVGVKKGGKKELKLEFPKDYHAKHLAGTKITFKVTIKSVSEKALPKLDDTFAASLGQFKTVAELKKDVKAQLAEQKTVEAENRLKDEIVEELVKKSKLTLPDVLVTDQVAMLEHDFNQNLMYRGITIKEYLEQEGFKDAEDWKTKELKPQAERRVSVGIVLAEVAEKEDLTVSTEELSDRITQYKQQYGKQAEQFDQPDMQREVASRLLTEKTVDRLYELATTQQ